MTDVAPADVTVVIPVKDRARTLHRALTSVSEQTVPPAQVIVVDDGSQDASAAVAEQFGAAVIRLPESRGSGPARNEGIRAARSTWIAFLDSDDTWRPDHLELVVGRAGEHVLLSTSARQSTGGIMGNPTEAVVPLDPARCFVPNTIVVTSGTLARRSALLDAGLFRALPRVQDLDLWARVLERGSGLSLPDPTVVYYRSERWTTVESDSKDQDGLHQVLTDFSDRPWASPSLRTGVAARVRWDALRLAQHDRRAGDAVRQAAWFARHPTAVRALIGLLQLRRSGRARASRLGIDGPGTSA